MNAASTGTIATAQATGDVAFILANQANTNADGRAPVVHGHATNSVALPFVQIANATTVEITRASGIGMQIAFTNALTGINLFTSTGVSSAFLIDYAGTTNSVNLTVTNTGVVIGWSAITLTNSGYGQLILRKPQGSETWRVDQ
jgi:hypothetical protein